MPKEYLICEDEHGEYSVYERVSDDEQHVVETKQKKRKRIIPSYFKATDGKYITLLNMNLLELMEQADHNVSETNQALFQKRLKIFTQRKVFDKYDVDYKSALERFAFYVYTTCGSEDDLPLSEKSVLFELQQSVVSFRLTLQSEPPEALINCPYIADDQKYASRFVLLENPEINNVTILWFSDPACSSALSRALEICLLRKLARLSLSL